MEERFKIFTGLITNISRCIQKIKNEEMAALGFKGRQVQCLFTLYGLEEGASVTQLCDMCGEDKGMMSRTIKGMVEQGLIYVDERKDQKYRNPLKLTDKGNEIAQNVSDKVSEMLKLGGRGVTDSERECLYSTLERISENLTKICENYTEAK